jgi:hypothetical protein
LGEASLFEAALQAAVTAGGKLAVQEQAKALLEAQAGAVGVLELFFEGRGHAGQAQGAQLVQGGV